MPVGIISRSIVSRAGAAECQPNHGATARDSCHRRRYDGVLAGWLRRIQVKKIAGKWLGTFRISARCIQCDLLVSNFKQGGVGHGPMVNC